MDVETATLNLDPVALVAVNVVHFRFTITNVGLTTLEDLVLTDSDFQGAIDATCALTDPLAPGASTECVIGPFDAEEGQHQNEGTVEALSPVAA